MFWLLKYFDNFKNFTSHSMSMLSSTRKLGPKGSTLSKSNLDMMKNSSHRDEYPAMQSNGPLPQVFQKEIDKVRGKIVKIIKIFEKLEHITHFGSKTTGHLLCRHSINYHLHLNSLSICN